MSFPEPTRFHVVTRVGSDYPQKAPAKPKKTKEVEKPKPEEEAEEAPAENGEAKEEVRPRGHGRCGANARGSLKQQQQQWKSRI